MYPYLNGFSRITLWAEAPHRLACRQTIQRQPFLLSSCHHQLVPRVDVQIVQRPSGGDLLVVPTALDAAGRAREKVTEDDGLVGAAAEQLGAVGCETDGGDRRGVVVQGLDNVVVSAEAGVEVIGKEESGADQKGLDRHSSLPFRVKRIGIFGAKSV
jgi:hypothetical protein